MEYEIGVEESVSTAVVVATSAVLDCDPDGLPPLTEVLDPDALDALYSRGPDAHDGADARVSFVYSGCRVSIDNGEYLTVQPLDGAPESAEG